MAGGTQRVVIIGLGRQGWALARQFLKLWGDTPGPELYVYDVSTAREDLLLPGAPGHAATSAAPAHRAYAAERLHRLRTVDPDPAAAIAKLRPDVLVNAATFTGHEFYTRAAVAADCDYVDLGQNTWQAMKQRALDGYIRDAGHRMRIVPECGLAPGLGNILGAWLAGFGGDSLQIRVGGLPMDTAKGGDLHYGLSWSLDGLIQEYIDATVARQDGRLISLIGLSSQPDREDPQRGGIGVAPFPIRDPALGQRLSAHMQPQFLTPAAGGWQIGHLEARPTSDGISLMPFDRAFDGLQQMEYKTLRYHAHFDVVERLLQDPAMRETMRDQLESAVPDLVLLRVWLAQAGTPVALVEGVALCDAGLETAPGGDLTAEPLFTAMQHLTGWPTVLVGQALLEDRAGAGSVRPDLFRADHTLWSGRPLDAALRTGGVIMPYELVDGRRMLDRLDSDALIPQREFHRRLPA